MSTPSAPNGADLYMLLGEINANVKSLASQLSAIDQRLTTRADGHETRLQALEAMSSQRQTLVPIFHALVSKVDDLDNWRTAVTTTAKTAGLGAAVLRWIGGGLFGIALVILAAFLANHFAMQQAEKLAHPPAITAPKG